MKKILTLICCLCMIFGGVFIFSACGEDNSPVDMTQYINDAYEHIERSSIVKNLDDEMFMYNGENYKSTPNLKDYITGSNGDILQTLRDWYANEYNASKYNRLEKINENTYILVKKEQISILKDDGHSLEGLSIARMKEHSKDEWYADITYAKCDETLTVYDTYCYTSYITEHSFLYELDINYVDLKQNVARDEDLNLTSLNVLDFHDTTCNYRSEDEKLTPTYYDNNSKIDDIYIKYAINIERNEKFYHDSNTDPDLVSNDEKTKEWCKTTTKFAFSNIYYMSIL